MNTKEILDKIQELNKIRFDNEMSKRCELRNFENTLFSRNCWPEFILREIAEHNSHTKYEIKKEDLLELLNRKYSRCISDIDVSDDSICIKFSENISTGYFPITDLDNMEKIAYGKADPSDIQDRINRKLARIDELEKEKKEEIDYYNKQIEKENDEINKLKSYL